ncbi:flagellar hook-basal body complex protein FliE [Paenibacillus koleovorans]|uniref:flagellar hook-basal body complex protein FliE n=1 Tax=Paenibacillus koleovorans TaxID=121608 RepID=UPI000FD977A3|nr:flagellar hook-basal body complex protein FliE [Paenibacillus koleovorans]
MIEKVGFLVKPPIVPTLESKTEQPTGAVDVSKSFGQFLNDALKSVEDQQKVTGILNEKFVTGELADVHQLTIAAERASLSLELTVQLRNKAIEAYQEIMRTQL